MKRGRKKGYKIQRDYGKPYTWLLVLFQDGRVFKIACANILRVGYKFLPHGELTEAKYVEQSIGNKLNIVSIANKLRWSQVMPYAFVQGGTLTGKIINPHEEWRGAHKSCTYSEQPQIVDRIAMSEQVKVEDNGVNVSEQVKGEGTSTSHYASEQVIAADGDSL